VVDEHDEGRARAHPFDGYWRDVGTIDAFHAAHMGGPRTSTEPCRA
jgi:ADP-glucose pyrophosphorylase